MPQWDHRPGRPIISFAPEGRRRRKGGVSVPFIISLASVGTSVVHVNGATTTLASAVLLA
jgi:hypothetical protein